MLRSILISSAFLGLAACGDDTMSASEQAFVDAVTPHCGPVDPTTNGRTCLAFLVYPDERPIMVLAGFDIYDNVVTAHVTWKDQRNGRLRSLESVGEAGFFGSNGGRVVGPSDHDYPIIEARFLGLEGRPS